MNQGLSPTKLLKKYPKLAPNCDDWENLEYNLKLAFASTSVKLLSAWSVSNPNLAVNFGKEKNAIFIDSWIEVNCLDENNTFDKVLERGFQFPNSGLIFPTGHINLTKQDENSSLIELLLVRIALKNPLGITANSDKFISDKKRIPSEFDSIYLINQGEDQNFSLENGFSNNYVLFEDNQALPIYVVHLELEKQNQKGLGILKCFLCQKNSLFCYCQTEDADLCYECDLNHHTKLGKLSSKHVRIPIESKPKNFDKCFHHPHANYEYYCPEDNQSLCVYCKINGSHSQGKKASHHLIEISEAYERIIQESNKGDQFLIKKKDKLNDKLNELEKRIEEINKNSKHVEDQIYEVLKSALQQLHNLSTLKLNLILSEKIEIRRQLNEISWLESFLQFQQDLVSPSEYLKSWARHKFFKDEILKRPEIEFQSVLPDLKLHGSLIIVADHEKDRIKSPQKQNLSPSKFQDDLIKSLIDNSLKVIDKKIFFSENNTSKSDLHFESPTLKKKTEFSIKEKQNFDNRHIEWGLFENKKKDLKKNDNFQDINNKIISHKIDFANISQENSPKKSDHEFSLRKYAEKNFLEIIKRYGDSFFNNIFPNSNILNEAESKILYCNLPIDIENPVNPILLWKKINPGLNSTSIHELFRDQSHQYPNILLFQIEDQKFGGFSSHPWTFFEKSFGDKSCFLFNITTDSRYIVRDSPQNILNQSLSSFSFGDNDLVIDNFFHHVCSKINNSNFIGNSSNSETPGSIIEKTGLIKPDLIELFILVPDFD